MPNHLGLILPFPTIAASYHSPQRTMHANASSPKHFVDAVFLTPICYFRAPIACLFFDIPPRKTLSSGCNCGTCSSPSRTADQHITRLPQSAVVAHSSSRHGQGWRPTVKTNCQAIVTPNQSFEFTFSDKSRPSIIASVRGPAQRMLFNPKTDKVSVATCDMKSTGVTFGGSACPRSSERKRGSDRNDSPFVKVPSAVTDTCIETSTTAAHRLVGQVSPGPIACPPVQAAANPGHGSQTSVPQAGRSVCFQTGEGLSLETASRSTAVEKVRSLGPPINNEVPFKEGWKAPETGGTFSLGASSKEVARGRRRRTLRMRVGG